MATPFEMSTFPSSLSASRPVKTTCSLGSPVVVAARNTLPSRGTGSSGETVRALPTRLESGHPPADACCSSVHALPRALVFDDSVVGRRTTAVRRLACPGGSTIVDCTPTGFPGVAPAVVAIDP